MPARKTQGRSQARRTPPRSAPTPGVAFTPPPKMPRYRVLSGGISTPTGPAWTGEVVTGERLGSAERIAALLDKGSIEVVDEPD